MFVPNSFKFTNDAEKIAFIRRYSFATMVTANGDIPLATQLPFVINEEADKLLLSAHMASANEQAAFIEAHTSLIIFSEPHAYISPVHYDKLERVPTWDYIAVHAYGKARIIRETAEKEKALEQMIRFYEEAYLKQWATLSARYKNGLMQGIVAFEVEVTELHGKKKLSQDKSAEERQRIIRQLEQSEAGTERDLAGYIKTTL